MSDINLDFIVNNNSINFTVQPNDITITPTDVQLTFATGAFNVAGGTNGQLQYNNQGTLGGLANTFYANGNLNLGYLNIKVDSNANSTINEFNANINNAFPNFSTNSAYQLTTQYHPNNSTNYPFQAIVRSRGNSITPTTAANGDRVTAYRYGVYNGNSNVQIGGETWTQIAGLTTNSNQAYAGGQWNIFTGNPSGSNLANSTATENQNSLGFTNSGSLQINPGTVPNTSLGQASSSILVTNYGASTANLVQVGGINFQRARGNRDTQQPVQAGDQVGRSVYIAYSNGAYQTGNAAVYKVVVDSTYVANDVIVPLSHQLTTVANVANVATVKTTSFYSNGLTSLPGNILFNSGANLLTNINGQIALGFNAGTNNQGNYSIAIGTNAGVTNQANNSIILNATNSTLDQTIANTFTVKPVRNASTANALYYNSITGEISYDLAPGGGGFNSTISNGTSNVSVGTLDGNITFGVGGNSNVIIVTSSSTNIGNLALKQFEENVASSANTGTSISPNVANSTIFNYVANANFSFNGLTGAVAGSSATVIITQDGTGNRLMTSTMKFSGGAKTLSTVPNTKDIVCLFYDGTTYFASLTRGYV